MKKDYWHIVLTAGFVLGVLYAATTFLSYVFYGNVIMGWICSIAGFGAIVWSLLFYGKKTAALKDVDGMGFSYGQAFGFSMLVLLLSGVIVGISQWTLQNVIDPVFYDQLYKTAIEEMVAKVPSAGADQIKMMKESQDMMRQMWAVILASMLSMALLGGIVALATSAAIKRQPKMF